jgi:hypothetical protein
MKEMRASVQFTKDEMSECMPIDSGNSLFDAEPPDVIYKYLSKENFERFISSKSLRVSQPIVLNDVFEIRARARSLFGRAHSLRFAGILETKFLDFVASDDFKVFLLRLQSAQQREEIDLTQIVRLRQMMRMPTIRDQMNEELWKRLNIEKIKSNFYKIAEIFALPPNLADKRDDFGLLCFSEDPLNQPMWAHYGDLGRGIVVGFDAKGSRFVRPPAEAGTDRAFLAKVQYDNKIADSMLENWKSIFLVKNTDWSYEKEWRCIFKTENLIESNNVDVGGNKIFLQSFIESDVVEILYGYNMKSEEIAKLYLCIKEKFPIASHSFVHAEFVEGLSAEPFQPAGEK